MIALREVELNAELIQKQADELKAAQLKATPTDNLARSASDRAHCAAYHCANASSNTRSALTAHWPMCGHPKPTTHFALTRPFALLCALPWVMTT